MVKSDGKIGKRTLGNAWRLLSFERDKNDRRLGPLAVLRSVDTDIFCTLSLLPESSANTKIRFDIYCIGNPRADVLNEFRSQMRSHWAGLEQNQTEEVQSDQIAVPQGEHMLLWTSMCLTIATGSMLDEIDKLLFGHRQQEQRAGKIIDPATKERGGSGEPETVVLCHALKRTNGDINGCPKQQEKGLQLEW